MNSGEDDLAPVNCFMSYRRADNAAYRNVVDQLKSDLSGRFEAETGRQLRIFIDRDDIGWGEDWRQKILVSIKQATFLMPVITMRYFDSDACREEFVAFYEDARRIGVTDLIMPIVLAGGSRITEDSPSEEMRIVHRLQHISIENAFIEGFNSPEWNRILGRMVSELSTAVVRAEGKLVNRESRSVVSLETGTLDESSSEEKFADLFELQNRAAGISNAFEGIEQDIAAVMEVLNPLLDAPLDLSTPAQRVRILSAASALREPAAAFLESTAALEERVSGVDSGMRLMLDEFSSMQTPQARELLDSLETVGDRSTGYEKVLAAMPSISDGLRMLGMTNINMRKAVQPVIRGFQSLQRTAQIVDSWSRFRQLE